MATNFPTSLDTFTTHSAGQVILSSDVNKVQDALLAVETKLGTGTNIADAGGAYIRGPLQISAHDGRIGQSIQPVAGTIYFWGFTNPWTGWTTTTVRWNTTANAGGAGTLQGFALYSADSSDNLTLLTSVSSTNLIASSTGIRTTTWGASQALTRGTRYVWAMLMTGTVAGTTVWGTNLAGTGPNEFTASPRLAGTFPAQTGFPASVTAANWATASSVNPWGGLS